MMNAATSIVISIGFRTPGVLSRLRRATDRCYAAWQPRRPAPLLLRALAVATASAWLMPLAPAGEATTLTLRTAGQWHCAQSRPCDARSESLAYVLGSPEASLYLSFSGELKAPLSLAALQKNFRHLDLYVREDDKGERWKLLGIATDAPAEGSVRFEQLDAHSVRLRLNARSYKLRTERSGPQADCATRRLFADCGRERPVNQALELELIVPLRNIPVSASSR